MQPYVWHPHLQPPLDGKLQGLVVAQLHVQPLERVAILAAWVDRWVSVELVCVGWVGWVGGVGAG